METREPGEYAQGNPMPFDPDDAAALPTVAPANDAEWIAAIDAQARELAVTLREASDAGVSHALILPRLILVFRESFGEPPAGFQLPVIP